MVLSIAPVNAHPQPDDPRPDTVVIASINGGRHEDFEVLYRRYCGWVYRLALRMTGDAEDAADVAQETFAYLVRRLPSLRLHARLTTFLYPAVKNLAITAARKRRRDVPQASPPGAPPVPTDPTSPDKHRALAEAVGALPDGQREVLLMRIVEEMSVSEIAAALDIPAGTVKSRLHHALGALREDARTKGYWE